MNAEFLRLFFDKNAVAMLKCLKQMDDDAVLLALEEESAHLREYSIDRDQYVFVWNLDFDASACALVDFVLNLAPTCTSTYSLCFLLLQPAVLLRAGEYKRAIKSISLLSNASVFQNVLGHKRKWHMNWAFACKVGARSLESFCDYLISNPSEACRRFVVEIDASYYNQDAPLLERILRLELKHPIQCGTKTYYPPSEKFYSLIASGAIETRADSLIRLLMHRFPDIIKSLICKEIDRCAHSKAIVNLFCMPIGFDRNLSVYENAQRYASGAEVRKIRQCFIRIMCDFAIPLSQCVASDIEMYEVLENLFPLFIIDFVGYYRIMRICGLCRSYQ